MCSRHIAHGYERDQNPRSTSVNGAEACAWPDFSAKARHKFGYRKQQSLCLAGKRACYSGFRYAVSSDPQDV
jgi:hypothetical protein